MGIVVSITDEDERRALEVITNYHWRAEASLVEQLETHYGIPFDRAVAALRSLQTKGLVVAHKENRWIWKAVR